MLISIIMNDLFHGKPYEPKWANRFLVTLPECFDIPDWVVASITKPKLKKGKWKNIKITFYDPIGPSTSQRLFHYVSGKGLTEKIDIPFDFQIESLDPIGVVIEKWTITVKEIVLIDFGDLRYDKDELQKPKLVLKPANCILNY